MSHPDAWPIDRAVIELGKVVPDFRAPDNLRFGLAPLYNSHLEVHTAIQRIKAIVGSGDLADFEARNVNVT